jgi:hypothetical protein
MSELVMMVMMMMMKEAKSMRMNTKINKTKESINQNNQVNACFQQRIII